MNDDELKETRSKLRREQIRVMQLVDAAREFMRLMAEHQRYYPGQDFNGETVRAWQDLQELCNAARPRVD